MAIGERESVLFKLRRTAGMPQRGNRGSAKGGGTEDRTDESLNVSEKLARPAGLEPGFCLGLLRRYHWRRLGQLFDTLLAVIVRLVR